MKIIKSGEVVAQMRDTPKDFEGGCKGGTVSVVVGESEVKLARYESPERAGEVLNALHDAYFAGNDEFIVPEEETKK